MTKLPFSRLLLCVALASTLGLTACDVRDSADESPRSSIGYDSSSCPGGIFNIVTGDCLAIDTPPPGTDYYMPGTHPRFTPAASDIPINTDIPFGGSTDGTAYVDMSDDPTDPTDDSNPTNPVYRAINDLDGWSVNAPFNIPFSAAIDDQSIDTDPFSPTANVFVIPLDTSGGNGDALDPDNIVGVQDFSPITGDPSLYPSLAVSVGDIDGVSGSVLRIAPTRALMPKTKYLVVLTNGITDAGTGDPTTASGSYELLGTGTCAADGINASLLPLCGAIDGWEFIASSFLAQRNAFLNGAAMLSLPTDPAVISQGITLTYTFTTGDPMTPLVGMGAPRAALFSSVASDLDNPGEAVATLNNLDAEEVIPTPRNREVIFPTPSGSNAFDLSAFSAALTAGRATLYTGTIELPYYLTAGSSSDFSFLQSFWKGSSALIGELGLPVPDDRNDLSGTDTPKNVTYRFPFAAPTTTVEVPLQVTLPNAAHQPAGFPATCGTAYGASGYPVAIYVHGITSDRTSVIALAHALASNACVATVAIDLPMHGVPANSSIYHYLNTERADLSTVALDLANAGANPQERHFEVVSNADGEPQAMNFASPNALLDGSGAWFINLGNLQNTRDNLRQAVMDLLNLNATLGDIDANDDGNPDFDTAKVSVVGVSLGGIIGSTFTTVNQLAIANDSQVNSQLGSEVFDIRLNPITALAISSPGGQLTRILENSLLFGPRILTGLGEAGAVPGTSAFESFLYVAQSTVDSGDPVNFAKTLAELGVPVLLQEVIGGGDASSIGTANDTTIYAADKVIPNNATDGTMIGYSLNDLPALHTSLPAPMAGTDPLAELLGLDQLTEGFTPGYQSVGSGLWLPITLGHHAALLRPNETSTVAPVCGEYAAFAEMQTQVVSFVATAGAQSAVGVAALPANPGLPTCTFSAGTTASFIGTIAAP